MPSRTASPAISRAARAASSGVYPSARCAASADECVHPEPCEAPSGYRSPGIRASVAPSKNTSVACSRWPPVTTTAAGPSRCSSRASSSASSTASPRATTSAASPAASPRATTSAASPAAARPAPAAVAASTRASGTFGVITVTRGSSSATIAARAGSSSSTAPDSATITGSSTTGVAGSSRSRARRTACTVSAVPSIPIFTASTPMSSATARTWATMKSPGTGWMPVTATVFWAVSAAIAVIPCTPQRANALRSAWIPAPPPESDPAIDSTAGTGRSLTAVRVERGHGTLS